MFKIGHINETKEGENVFFSWTYSSYSKCMKSLFSIIRFMKIPFYLFIFFLFQLCFSKSILPTYSPDVPKPDQSESRYGKHELNVLDSW
tara:strand:- start:4678 stop:4944 length:267 start_codon:yes stop_codon:yes gene_type:complete